MKSFTRTWYFAKYEEKGTISKSSAVWTTGVYYFKDFCKKINLLKNKMHIYVH